MHFMSSRARSTRLRSRTSLFWPVLFSVLLSVFSVSLVWEGGGGCAPHSEAGDIELAFGYSLVAVAVAGVVVAALVLRARRGLRWWVGVTLLWPAVFVAAMLHFAGNCAA